MTDLTDEKRHNPDVLSCLANLSNDEVFTPPRVVNEMLDLLPQELFRSPDTKFLDPACKSGVFLREIARRLIEGLAEKIPNLQKRVDHVLHHQVYGIAITELTSLVSRRTLYCSKYPQGRFSVSAFDSAEGNIRFRNMRHTWKDGKCIWCGVPENNETFTREGMEVYAYEFIHTHSPEGVFNMKFDVIIGNPPYQLDDGGNSASAKPIYNLFVEQALKLNPRYLTMIVPARWYNGGKGLDSFRKKMLNEERISILVDYPNSKECFPNLSIGGGVCYFLWAREKTGCNCEIKNITAGQTSSAIRSLNEFPSFVRYNKAVGIIRKVLSKKENNIVSMLSSRNPFGIQTNERGKSVKNKTDLTIYSSKGIGYLERSSVTQGQDLIDKYKIKITRTLSEYAGEPDKNGKFKVLSSVSILEPGEVCTDSYIIACLNGDPIETQNFYEYLNTKFSRFLLLQAVSSINLTRDVYSFVPQQDFSRKWPDKNLYKKYGLTNDEIEFIENTIKPMDTED